MKGRSLFISSFMTVALAQIPTDTINVPSSIAQIIATAIPSSLLQEWATDPGARQSQISSQFAAGETPDWFKNLPTEVKSWLPQPTSNDSRASNSTNSSLLGSRNVTMISTSTSTTTPTQTVSPTSSTGSTTSSASGSSTISPAPPASDATRAISHRVYGIGIAGVAGVLGVVAL